MILNLVLVLSPILFYTEAIVNPQGPTVVKDFSNCVTDLMEHNFRKEGLLIFVNTNNVSTSVANIRSELLRNINSKLIYSVEVKNPRDEPAICVRNVDDNYLSVFHKEIFEPTPLAEYYIVVIDNYSDFTRVASCIIRSRSWNPLAKFLILLFHFANSTKSIEIQIENMLTCLFRHNVINIAVIVPEVNNIRNAIVYSWRPFEPPIRCGYFNETAINRLKVENICEKGVVKSENDIYRDRVPDSMMGCTLNILALQRQPFVSADPFDPNMEKKLINELATKYGFEINYQIINSFRGVKFDGKWEGALNKLVAKKGHILLGGIFPDNDVHEDFICSETYLADSYTWVAPKAFPSPPWVALLVIFQRVVWYCAVAGFVLCVCAWKIFGILSKDSTYHRTFRHCFMNAWISMFGFCAYARPVKQSLRMFYVFFNLYCILFLTGYQTKLIDVLKNPTFEEQIDTIEKLIESDLKFGGFEEVHDLFYNSSDPFDNLIGEKWVPVDNISKALIDVAVYRNFTVLCSRMELAHLAAIMPELSDSFGNNRYYAFDTNTFSVPMEMVALKGFAFMEKFSATLRIHTQMGVNSGVRRQFAQLTRLRRANLLRTLDREDELKPLSLQHLQGGFLALIMGYLSGAISLLVEIFINSEFVTNKISNIRLVYRRKFIYYYNAHTRTTISLILLTNY
ncbi:uncharacterized protein LOC113231934 [Hyposmocoma kahamanoa]|uniref:uncharacterized protein LOC113231934 n=1 Tax=Hyposmocoma kahamanoa TaxID=1477025 RepID=UPI000E6D7B6B|nr:uncharacterized protein LOC113231934 [Hyposmocoma kahamanoa]